MRRQTVDSRVFYRVVSSAVRLHTTRPQKTYHFDRFLEHFQPLPNARPLVAENMLIQIFARTDAEEESARHRRCNRSRGLSDDRRMNADERTGDAGSYVKSLCALRNCTENSPDKWTLSLSVNPRVKMVGDQRELESRLLGAFGVTHQIRSGMFLAR